MSKPVWANSVERNAWVEKHCARCFQTDEAAKRVLGSGDGCPHLRRGDANRLPRVWKKRRNTTMGDTYTCSEFRKEPPVNRRATVPDQTPPLFDLPEAPYLLIPVEGWPDYRGRDRKGDVDHQ